MDRQKEIVAVAKMWLAAELAVVGPNSFCMEDALVTAGPLTFLLLPLLFGGRAFLHC